MSADSLELYFASGRPDGHGGVSPLVIAQRMYFVERVHKLSELEEAIQRLL